MTERGGKGKGKGKAKDRHKDTERRDEKPESRWQPKADRKPDTASDWKPVNSDWKPVDREGAEASSSSSQPAPSSGGGSAALSTSAASFVPGQGFKATAAAFVPSTAATTFVTGQASVAEFVPGQSWSWPDRGEAPAEFVPGQSSWSGAPDPSLNQAGWQPNVYAADYQNLNTMYGAGSYPSAPGVVMGTGVQCLINLDDFSSDSDSDSSSSKSPPRGRDAQDPQPSTAAPSQPTKVEEPEKPEDRTPGPASAAPPAVQVEDRAQAEPSSTVDKAPVATDAACGQQEPDAKPDAKSQPIEPQATPTLVPAALESPPTTPAALASPGNPDSSEFHSPVSGMVGESPMLTASPTTALTQPDDYADLSATDAENDELGGSFRLPRAAQADDYYIEASLASEMNDRTLRHWLQRFVNEGDGLAFSRQYHRWTDNGTGVGPQEVVSWLMKRGLDDFRGAAQATEALSFLLRKEGLPVQTVEQTLAEYSEEDLEDMQLDNPKAMDFVIALRDIIANPPPVEEAEQRSEEVATAAPEPDAERTRTETWQPEELMKVHRAMVQYGYIDIYSGPRWSTEAAEKHGTPLAPWQQRSMARGSEGGGPASGSDWRDGKKRTSDRNPRGQKGEDGGRKRSSVREAPIAVSETSWVAQTRRWKADSEAVEENCEDGITDEIFLRDLRLTLNKLTVEKFDNLSDHLILLISKSTRPNRGIPALMQLVFEKATTQHHFIDMYVSLCVKLHQWLTANNEIIRVESQTNFKRILLNQCQNSFELYLEPPDTLDGLSGEILYEAQVKYKTKMLGNIKLVGQLIRHGMLSPKIALSVAAELVRDDPIVREERLETLAVFLETIGPSLDDPNWSHSQQFETIFAEVDRLSIDKSVNSRTRYLLIDVLDLRRGKWLSCKVRKFDEDAPTTLAEVHEKAKEASKGGGKGSPAGGKNQGLAFRDSPDKNRKKTAANSSPSASPKSKPSNHKDRGRLLSSPGAGGGTSCTSDSDTGSKPAPKRQPLNLKPASAKSEPKAPEAKAPEPVVAAASVSSWRPSAKGDPLADLQKALAGAAMRATKPKEEILAEFHKEVAQVIRQVGNSMTASEGVTCLRECSLPSECVQEEVVDLIARMVDEPRERRQHMFPLLLQLFDAGVFSPPGLLGKAVTSFIEDAFADLSSVDPPDLMDIVLRELFPALRLDVRSLSFTPCVAEIFAEADLSEMMLDSDVR